MEGDKEEKKEDLIGESDIDVNLISLFLFLIYNLLMITSDVKIPEVLNMGTNLVRGK